MKRYHYSKKPVWIENGEAVGTVSGVGMQRLALIYRPTPAQTRKMLRAVRMHHRASLSGLGVIFGTGRCTVRQWLKGTKTPSGPSTRAIWMMYVSALHPEVLDNPDALITWARPGIGADITSEEFLKRILKRRKGRKKRPRVPGNTTGCESKA